MYKKYLILIFSILVLLTLILFKDKDKKVLSPVIPKESPNPLTISAMRARSYPGSDLKIEQTLADGTNYYQYIASYISDGLKIYGLLTVPVSGGNFPVIVFNHGYIPPTQYRTTERYVAYMDSFARNGYVS